MCADAKCSEGARTAAIPEIDALVRREQARLEREGVLLQTVGQVLVREVPSLAVARSAYQATVGLPGIVPTEHTSTRSAGRARSPSGVGARAPTAGRGLPPLSSPSRRRRRPGPPPGRPRSVRDRDLLPHPTPSALALADPAHRAPQARGVVAIACARELARTAGRPPHWTGRHRQPTALRCCRGARQNHAGLTLVATSSPRSGYG
jgi:hypothetical protein